MSRLTGIMAPGREPEIADLLRQKLCPRYQVEAMSSTGATVGLACLPAQHAAEGLTCDGRAPSPEFTARVIDATAAADIARLQELLGETGTPFALAATARGHLLVARDPSGAIPLYLGVADKTPCYASELKLLHGWAGDIRPLPPGAFVLDGGEPVWFSVRPESRVEPGVMEAEWASRLRLALAGAVAEQGHDECGVLLSGGLDSSAVAVMAARAGYRGKAFTVAYPGGRDLEHAVMLAESLGWPHYVCRPSLDDLLASLPEVIYRLESFDAPLVRSAAVNYQLNRLASDYVSTVLCGEGADELFAGYDFLGPIPRESLAGELVRLLEELPNGGMQRVDRMAHAHGLEPRAPFLSPAVMNLARAMPPEVKIGPDGVKKWILRRASASLRDNQVLPKGGEKMGEVTKHLAFCVLGAGHGGMAMAGHLAMMGVPIRMYNRSEPRIAPIRLTGGIELSGAIEGFGPIAVATTDPAEALHGAKVLMVVVPANGHAYIAGQVAPHLVDGQIVVLNPGRTGGAFEFRHCLQKHGVMADVIIVEAQTLIYACRAINPAQVKIFGIKNTIPAAALPGQRTVEALNILRQVYPQFVPGDNVLKTSLDNIGAVFHPALMVLNAARIESTRGEFQFYMEGITSSTARVLEAVDAERVAVAAALGIRAMTAREWLYMAYDAAGKTLYDAIRNNTGYEGIYAPPIMDHRYIWEDVPMSLVPIAALGEQLGVTVTTLRAVIYLASLINQTDYWECGRTAERMGLAGLTVREIRHLALEGEI